MSIKLMDGKRVVDFRVEEVKATTKIEKPVEKEDTDFFESKWFKIFAAAIIILAIALHFIPEKSTDEKLGYKIGNYAYTHKLVTGEPVYRVITPRGPEWVVGRDNLDASLEAYTEAGVEGEDYRNVEESDIYPDLKYTLKEIEQQIEQQEKEVEEFDKKNLQPEEEK